MLSEKFLILVLLIVGATRINGASKVSDIKGRLLTPDEGCGVSDAMHNRIVGGGPAKNGAWPWLALLGRVYNGIRYSHATFLCGGSLITSKHVLTAAHCFKQSTFDTVRLGEYDKSTKDDGEHIDVPIDHVDKHSNFSQYMIFTSNDIAVVHMKRHVDFTDRVRPICLPNLENMKSLDLADTNPFVAGWGSVQEGDRKMSDVMHEIQLPVVENDVCKKRYRNHYHLDHIPDYLFDKKSLLCAGFVEGGKDSCQGDSGGPLFLPLPTYQGFGPLKWKNGFAFYQIGIVSSGKGCGRAELAGMYTNVQHQIDWIKDKLYSTEDDEN